MADEGKCGHEMCDCARMAIRNIAATIAGTRLIRTWSK